MSTSDSASTVPGFQVTFSASRAASACPNVSATTATPVGTTPIASTPGIFFAAALSTDFTVPLIVGGRRTTVGIASGTSWSSVYLNSPVTIDAGVDP